MPYRGSTAAVVIRFISVQLDYGLISQSVLQMQFKPEHNQPFRNFCRCENWRRHFYVCQFTISVRGLDHLEGELDCFEGLSHLEGLNHLDLEGMYHLEGLNHLEGLDHLDGLNHLEKLDHLDGLEHLERLNYLKGLDNLEGLNHLEGLGSFERIESF